MSFQAYIKNIQEKTGKTPADFKEMAKAKGFTIDGTLAKSVKTAEITNWLREEFQLGHGHAMAIYALLKGTKDENSK